MCSGGFAAPEAAKMDVLLKWAAEIGVSDSPPPTTTSSQPSAPPTSCLGHSLVLAHFPDAGGRGLAAARELRKGELVLRVPRAALLTKENALARDPDLAARLGSHSYLSPTQILIICLLAEVGKARGSWWYPYLRQLPHSYDVVASFSKFEIQAFQVEDAIGVSDTAVSKAKMEWEHAVLLIKEMELRPQLLSFKSWLWASATVSSRALHVPWDSAGCLCPVGDFFNYAAPAGEEREVEASCLHGISKMDVNDHNSTVELSDTSLRLTDGGFEEGLNSYCFYARKRYQKGEQVLLGYGTYTNLELLEYYGFLLNPNPNDKTFIPLEGLIQASNWPKDSLYIHQNGCPSFSLISALRLMATPRNLRKAVGFLAYSGTQLSVDNEIAALRYLAKCCCIALQKLPTSVEDDRVLLDTINKCLSCSSLEELAAVGSYSSELTNFLEGNNVENGESIASPLPVKARRSMERWRLAVQWRMTYKTSLYNCISHCKEVIDGLS